jgi:Fic family protein
MEAEKGKTYRYLREKREVNQSARDNLKTFVRIEKSILGALRETEMTIDQISKKTGLPKDQVVYYLMSLLKYGKVQTGTLDDMDEYYTYKLKSNG